MPTIGDADDYHLWVPDGDSEFLPAEAPFISAQNSVLRELKRVLARMRSQVLYTDRFEANDNWSVQDQKIRIVGEVWGYFQLTIERTKSKVTVPNDGNFSPIVLGSFKDPNLVPQSLASLGSVNTGRLCSGHILNSGEVKLDAIQSGRDIEVGDILTLAGSYPLDNWQNSEV